MRSFGFQWHVTDRCNRRCRHCYQSEFTARTERPIGDLLAMADRIFSALADRRISVNVTGGEPLLYPRIFELIGHLHSFKNLKEVHVITNGTCASDETLSRLKGLPKVKYLKVSVEAGDAAVNDAIRGKGNLNKVRANIGRFKSIARKKVILMATLGRYNAGAVGGVMRFAREAGVAGVIFERFVPLGQGRGIIDEVLGPRSPAPRR
jgi:MoaA/NifB/PqqE/SkfB family radical SAM enzyme